jgi:hypothetical protein
MKLNFFESRGGRVAEGDTPYGAFRVEWDGAGKLVSESIQLRTPPPPPSVPTNPQPRRCAGCGGMSAAEIEQFRLEDADEAADRRAKQIGYEPEGGQQNQN